MTLGLSLLAAILWGLALASVGARARRLARLPVAPDLRLPVDFLLGAWVLSIVALLCGLCGAFRPGPLLLAAGGLLAAGRFEGQGWRWRPVLPALPPALLLLPVSLAPPFFHDALVYHLGLPWQALQEGGLGPHREDLFAAFPPLAQLVAAFPLAAGLERVPALLHLLSFMSAGAALVVLARRLGAPAALADLASVALPILPALALVPSLPAAEGWTLAAIVSALGVALGGAGDRRRDGRGRAILAGFLVGLASAARLQGVPWSVLVLALVAATARRPLSSGLLGLAGWIAGSAPWWLKNLILLGDPLAPLGWRREGIETLWRDAGSTMHLADTPGAWLRAFLLALAPHVAYLAPLALTALLATILGRARRAAALLGAVALGGAVAWSLTGSLPRFMAPTLAVLLALAAAAAGTGPIGRFAAWLAIVTAAALGLAFSLGQLERWGGARLAIARPDTWPPEIVINNPEPAFEAARLLPPDARVLFVGETRGFRFPRIFVAPSQHDVSPLRGPLERLASAEEARDWLLARGYTHLLVNRGELSRLAPTHPVAPWSNPQGMQRFQELLNLAAPPVVLQGEVAIFSLTK